MNVVHVLEDYSHASGGIRTVVKDLYRHLDINHKIITLAKEDADDEALALKAKGPWRVSKEFSSAFQESISGNDKLVHIHGVWMYPQYISSKISVINNKPFVLTPHGMFEPWLWKQGYLKKKIYFNFISKPYFKKANVIHAITEDERDNLSKLFRGNRIEVIPNLISSASIPKLMEEDHHDKYILFLGRIHPKKGIDMLIKSLSTVSDKKIKLKIAGPKNDYVEKLESLVRELLLNDRVEFLGMVKGREKFQLYKNAHVFVAPSHSEVVGMVNLEAAIVGTAVITTFQTGLLKGWNKNGGMLINPIQEELNSALEEACSWSADESHDRGKQIQRYVMQNYSWENNKYRWIDLYGSL